MDRAGKYLPHSQHKYGKAPDDDRAGCASAGGSSLDCWPVPALDDVEDSFLLLPFGRESGHSFPSNDRFSRTGVDDSGEYGSSMAPVLCVALDLDNP